MSYPNRLTNPYAGSAYLTAVDQAQRPAAPSYPTMLQIQEGTHLNLTDTQLLPYRLVENLGYSASASVEKVEDALTGSVYARKVFRHVHRRNFEEVRQRFQDEIRIMQRLSSHPHMIKVHASYITGMDLAVILHPVADEGDLATYLVRYRNNTEIMGREHYVLLQAFGCLSMGLEFIHRHTIRHKDIKPQNILVHQGKVMYTDFGIARDYSDTGVTTTTGHPGSFTCKYRAPEVADFDRRNSKADVFSLGCVFLEMYAALYPQRIPGSLIQGCYYQNIGSILECLTINSSFGEGIPTTRPYILRKVISAMLTEGSSDRASAKNICWDLEYWRVSFGLSPHFSPFCPDCHSQMKTW